MKRLAILFIYLPLFLVACNSSEYQNYIDAGNDAVHEEDYPEATKNYSKAMAEKDTDEAKQVHSILKKIQDGEEAFQNGNFEQSIALFEEVMEVKEDEPKIIGIIQRDASRYLEESQTALSSYETIAQLIKDGDTKLENSEFDEAIRLYEKAGETGVTINSSKITNTMQVAKALKVKAENAKKDYEQLQAEKAQKVKEEAKKEEVKKQQEQQKSAKISHSEAAEYVKKYLIAIYDEDIFQNPNIHLNYDHDNEHGDYVFQLYEVVIDDPDTKMGHTATWGWYGIDPVNKTVYDAFNY